MSKPASKWFAAICWGIDGDDRGRIAWARFGR